MLIKKLSIVIVVFCYAFIGWIACGEKDDDDEETVTPTPTSSGNTAVVSGDVEVNVFTMGKQAGPMITGSLSLTDTTNCTLTNKETLTTIFQLIKDYDGSGDTMSQCVDGSNIYVSLDDAQGMVKNVTEKCTQVDEQDVVSNFDFGADKVSSKYNCYYTGSETSGSNEYFRSYAFFESGDELFGTFGHYHTETTQNNPRSLEFHYDKSDETIMVNQAYLVNYTSGEKYNVRIHLDGNVSTNLFSMKLWKGGTSSTGDVSSSISIAGYGKAEDGYFIFKVCRSSDSNYSCDAVENKYYCFQSDISAATINGWADSEDNGHTTAEIAAGNCADYQDEVDAITMFTSADQADETSDFTGTGTGNYILKVVTE